MLPTDVHLNTVAYPHLNYLASYRGGGSIRHTSRLHYTTGKAIQLDSDLPLAILAQR